MSADDDFTNAAGNEKQTARLEAFSDGVFGIAMTLLVLDLHVPNPPVGAGPYTSAGLGSALASQWPAYFAFVTSFASVLIMWMHHHAFFRLVRCVDATLLFVNGLLLLLVTVVPFPTAVVAKYFSTPAGPAACTLYAGMFVVISVVFYLVLLAALRPSIVFPTVSPRTLQRLRRTYSIGPPLYLLATIAAPFSRWLSMGICTALWLYWVVTARRRDIYLPPAG
jgi:uncharacterized membrane protein